MRIREVIREAALTTPPGQAPGQTPGKEGQDIGKLTATIDSLQKQIADLQKAALQQADAQTQGAPGEAGQAQQQQQQQVVAQTPGKQQAQPIGQEPVPGTPTIKPAQKTVTKAPPGVSQPPQITNLKIKQSLAKTQGGGTK